MLFQGQKFIATESQILTMGKLVEYDEQGPGSWLVVSADIY